MTYNNFESFANARGKNRKSYNHQNRNNNSKRKKFDLSEVTIPAIEDLYRENQFLKRKLNMKDDYIRQLEYDNALLQRKKMEFKELLIKKQNGFAGRNNQGKYRGNNGKRESY